MRMGRFSENQDRIKWTAVVESIYALAGRVWWIDRFRWQYYLDLNYQIKSDGSFRYFLRCLAGLGFHTWEIILALFRMPVSPFPSPTGPIFLLSDNNTYLMHLLPILGEICNLSENPTVMVRRAHRKAVEDRLSVEAGFSGVRILTYNELARGIPFPERPLLLLKAVGGSLKDLVVWWGSGMWRTWLIFPRFMTFSLMNRFYSSIVSRSVQGTSAIVAANDHSMWESLVFGEAGPDTGTFLVQHGVLARFSWPAAARKILVWGERHRTMLTGEMDAPSDAVTVIGAPGFDLLSAELRDRPRKDKDTVCFLSQFHGTPLMGFEGYSRAVEMFCQLAENSSGSGLKFVIKLHPRDSDRSIEPYEKRFGKSVQITRENLLQVLDRTILTVLVDSTAIFESVLMDIPVVQLKPEGLLRFADFSSDGLTILCQNPEDLRSSFQAITGGGKASSDIHESMKKGRSSCLANLGNAAQTGIGIIMERNHE